MSVVELQAGDVVLTRSDTLLGAAIRFAEGRPGDPATYNHVGVVTSDGTVGPRGYAAMAEALWRVRAGFVWYLYGPPAGAARPSVAVWRPGFMDARTRARVARIALAHVGERYGWWKLFAHLGDAALSRLRRRDVRVLRRSLFASSRPICSYLVADAFHRGAGYTFGVPPHTASPDDFDDWFTRVRSRSWTLVYRGTIE